VDFTSIDTGGDQCISYDELRNFKVGEECPDTVLADCEPCNEGSYSKLCRKCDMITTCSGHGRCIGSSGSCKCHDGWSGESCNVYILKQCPDGFSKTDCKPCDEKEYSNCSKSCDMMETCHGHGRCIGSSGSCKCHNGWSGESCNVPDCKPCTEDTYSKECSTSCDMTTTCSGHGRCNGSSGTCQCHGVWTGKSCNETDVWRQFLIGFDVDKNMCLNRSEFETATARPVRLAGCGTDGCSRIEVEQSGKWGTVCGGKTCFSSIVFQSMRDTLF